MADNGSESQGKKKSTTILMCIGINLAAILLFFLVGKYALKVLDNGVPTLNIIVLAICSLLPLFCFIFTSETAQRWITIASVFLTVLLSVFTFIFTFTIGSADTEGGSGALGSSAGGE